MTRRYPNDGNATSGLERFLVAPVSGLKTNEALGGLSPQFALTADNLICQPDSLVSRPGSVQHTTDAGIKLKTLFSYRSPTTGKLFAAADTGIRDVSAPGTPSAIVAALTKGDGHAANISTSAGAFLYFMNGLDDPWLYNGATWTQITNASTPAITGVATNTLIDPLLHRNRLFILAQGELGFRSLPVDSVGGLASAFPLGAFASRGGFVQGHASWTFDGGAGVDDFYVVATSEGEVLVFTGSDPLVPTDWSLQGVFFIGKPVGRNCFAKMGGDLLYLCDQGIFPLSRALQSTTVDSTRTITRNIDPTVQTLVREFRTQPGWQVLVLPRLSLVVLTVPSTSPVQYVLNTISGGWSRLIGWPSQSWHEFNGRVFAARDGFVDELFVGASDRGAYIPWVLETSYNRFRTLRQLQPLLVRPLVARNGPVTYSLGFAQDFAGAYFSQTIFTSGGDAALWDSALWDRSVWGGSFVLDKSWRTVASRSGIAHSVQLAGASRTSSIAIIGFDFKFAKQSLTS